MAITGKELTALYERHATAMVAAMTRRTFDAQVALDIVGETFAIGFEQRERFVGDPNTGGRAWLTGIAKNLLSDYFRSGQIERRAMQRLGVPQQVATEDDFTRIESLAGSAEMRAAVATGLERLSTEQRQAVQLRVVEELPYDEVAAALFISEPTARARVSRALRTLRDHIESTEEDQGVIENV